MYLMRGRLHKPPGWRMLGLASRREQCRLHTCHSTSNLQVRGVHTAALLLQRKPGRCWRTPSTRSTTTMPAASALRSCTGKQLCSCNQRPAVLDCCQTSRNMPDLWNGFLIEAWFVQECVQHGHQQVWRSFVQGPGGHNHTPPSGESSIMAWPCPMHSTTLCLLVAGGCPVHAACDIVHHLAPNWLQDIAALVEDAQGDKFLRELKLRWDNHNKSMHMIRDILMVIFTTSARLPRFREVLAMS